jgi:hypothetical protein
MLSLCLVFSLLCGVGNALEQNELVVSVVMTNQNAYPGGTILASIYLKNNSTDILTIQKVGLQFDWMPSDQFLGYDLSDNPIVIIPAADKFVDTIPVILPENVTLGEHSYFVGINGLNGTGDFAWDSQTFTLLVQDPEKEEYDALSPQVSGNITASEDKNYQSSRAQSLLGQAKAAYEQALIYGDQNSWDEGISLFNNALTYLDQANAEEQQYLAEERFNETLYLILGVVAVAVVAILVIIYLLRRRRVKPQPQT